MPLAPDSSWLYRPADSKASSTMIRPRIKSRDKRRGGRAGGPGVPDEGGAVETDAEVMAVAVVIWLK